MKIVILGGSGMLGHKLWQTLASRFETYATLRRELGSYSKLALFDESRALTGVSVEDFETVEHAIQAVGPDVVINCVGIVKQQHAAQDPIATIDINALFPHRLARLCAAARTRLVHLSTDCVFSGSNGNYSESDKPDADDLYGRTKLLGEVAGENCLTLRTSMIGRELQGSYGLLEWFLSQRGTTVRGFKRAVFSGFTTEALAVIIGEIIARHPELSGVRHVASEPINKFDLLSLIKQVFKLDIEIEPNESFICDRSLNGERFRQATGLVSPTWPEMIDRMMQDKTPYEEIRRKNAG